MSRLLDLQRRLVEVGRIRMGTSTPGPRGGKLPQRLGTWRFTSRDEYRIRALAGLYGGEPRPWPDRPEEWEVVTESDRVPVMLLPGHALTQAWELWGQVAPGKPNACLRRCDGERQMNDEPCACPPYDERLELATKGKACKPTSRLSVLLPEVVGIGTWRLTTHGVYAAIELAGLVDLLEEITRRGMPQRAVLRIDSRTVVRPDTVMKFPVPVLDILERPADLLGLPAEHHEAIAAPLPESPAGIANGPAERQPGYTPLPAGPPGPSVAEAVEQTQRLASSKGPTSGRQAEPLRTPPSRRRVAEGLPTPPNEGEPEPEDEPVVAYLSEPQRRFLWGRARELDLGEAEVRALVEALTGQESTAAIPAAQLDELLASMEAAHEAGKQGEPEQETLDVGPGAHDDRG